MLSTIASHAVTLMIGASFGCLIAASLRGLARRNGEYDRALNGDTK